jgi:hypothetical protein
MAPRLEWREGASTRGIQTAGARRSDPTKVGALARLEGAMEVSSACSHPFAIVGRVMTSVDSGACSRKPSADDGRGLPAFLLADHPGPR